MKQFILKEKPGKDNIVRLKNEDYKYLVRVRRLAAGEFFPALLPDGTETLVRIISVEKNVLTGVITKDISQNPQEDAENIAMYLFQALPKNDKMDLIVRQAAEGGITEIVPFVSEYSVANTKADGQKLSRWERIIKEARQQSGSKIATVIHKTLTMKELFDYWKKININSDAIGLLFHHQNKGVEQKTLHGYLNNTGGELSSTVSPGVLTTVLAIGPEGGFSDTEVSLFLKNGFKQFTIGSTVLRTETAALYCAAAVKIILLEKDSWQMK